MAKPSAKMPGVRTAEAFEGGRCPSRARPVGFVYLAAKMRADRATEAENFVSGLCRRGALRKRAP